MLMVLALGSAGIGAAIAFLPATETDRPADGDDQATSMVRLLEDFAEMSDEDGFKRPSGPWKLALPEDHGGHPAARAETWMIAAHLEDEDGEPLGLTFFLSRFGLRSGDPTPGSSPWDLRSLYGAQVTFAQKGGLSSLSEQRLSRGAGAAGHDLEAREVWLDDWQLTYGMSPNGNELRLTASVEGKPIRLKLVPIKAARQASGDNQAPVRGFSVPRMDVEGSVGFGPSEETVSGLAWLDRLWGELPPPGGPLAYDRLVLQLNDGTDVSVLRSQRRDGHGSSTLDGVIVYADGEVEVLSETALEMTAVDHLRLDDEDTVFPVGWQLDGSGLELQIAPLADDRGQGFLLGGWNGTVTVAGRHDGTDVSGLGTLQVTGLENP